MFDRAVRDITVKTGTHTNCGGIAKILADVEPSEEFAFVDEQDGAWVGDYCDPEDAGWCAGHVRDGVVEELTRLGDGTIVPVRFVLRRILVHPVDSAPSRNQEAGRKAVTEAVRRLTAATRTTAAPEQG